MAGKSNKAQARVSRIYAQRCSGVQINIMDMGRVMRVGLGAIEAGCDDQGVGDTIAAFVETIRCN